MSFCSPRAFFRAVLFRHARYYRTATRSRTSDSFAQKTDISSFTPTPLLAMANSRSNRKTRSGGRARRPRGAVSVSQAAPKASMKIEYLTQRQTLFLWDELIIMKRDLELGVPVESCFDNLYTRFFAEFTIGRAGRPTTEATQEGYRSLWREFIRKVITERILNIAATPIASGAATPMINDESPNLALPASETLSLTDALGSYIGNAPSTSVFPAETWFHYGVGVNGVQRANLHEGNDASGSYLPPPPPSNSVGLDFPPLDRVLELTQFCSPSAWGSDTFAGPSVPGGHSAASIRAHIDTLDRLLFFANTLKNWLTTDHAACCGVTPM
ncbi:hypothetical protein NMY22_g18159 [Coprinellus aureogranulatus]|nr:hypothetical protein NMY22_g18159 [Coprinellus aureogranulatus]